MKYSGVAGLSDKAMDYINKNSMYTEGEYIGCKNSTGLLRTSSSLYKKEETPYGTVFLFKYHLLKGERCYEELQTIINNVVFVQLRKPDDKVIKWTKREINNYICNCKIDRVQKTIERLRYKIKELELQKI